MYGAIDFAWAAGFLDGEGCFYARRNNNGLNVRISAAQKQLAVLDHLSKVLGCGSICLRSDGKCWVWTANTAKDVRCVLDVVHHHLVAKREQADILSELCADIGMEGVNWFYRADLIDKLKKAKHHGAHVPVW